MEAISKFLVILRIRSFIVNWMKSYSTWDFIQFEAFLGYSHSIVAVVCMVLSGSIP